MHEKVLLVDDHVLFRKGLSSLLRSKGTMEVIGEAGDGYEALEKARRSRPDVVLMDIHMPVCDGLEATRLIKAELPNCKVVILTVSDEDDDLFEAVKAGAHGYLLKNLEPEQLFNMVEGVMRGEAPLSPTVATRILAEFAQQLRRGPQAEPAKDILTAREKEVLHLVANGESNRVIASALCITENTVKNHLRNILEKLHLHNRVQLAAYAVREELHNPAQSGLGEPR